MFDLKLKIQSSSFTLKCIEVFHENDLPSPLQCLLQAMAQKEDMEKKISTLEKHYLATQREAASVHDLSDKLKNEIANKGTMHQQVMAFTELCLTFTVVNY